jgi:hypothetical protein
MGGLLIGGQVHGFGNHPDASVYAGVTQVGGTEFVRGYSTAALFGASLVSGEGDDTLDYLHCVFHHQQWAKCRTLIDRLRHLNIM